MENPEKIKSQEQINREKREKLEKFFEEIKSQEEVEKYLEENEVKVRDPRKQVMQWHRLINPSKIIEESPRTGEPIAVAYAFEPDKSIRSQGDVFVYEIYPDGREELGYSPGEQILGWDIKTWEKEGDENLPEDIRRLKDIKHFAEKGSDKILDLIEFINPKSKFKEILKKEKAAE